MNKYEREEVSALPEKYKPMGAWGYWGWSFLFSIPLIGFIILIATAIGSTNINRRSYARSYFCGFFIAVLVVAGLVALAIFVFPEIMEYVELLLALVIQPE